MKSEFLESELELYVQRLLIHESYATGNKYRMLKISPSEERLKGYDAQIVGLTPFYCQFKTSDLMTGVKGICKKRFDFCKTKGWPVSPFYAFSLRKPHKDEDKNSPDRWQHNILHNLWRENKTGVAYVAPLFHTRLELDLHEPPMRRSCCCCRLLGCGCDDTVSSIYIDVASINGRQRCRLPFFDGLISIPPYVPVKDLKHHYAFTSHRDITFHSDPELVEDGKPLGKTLEHFVSSSLEREEQVGQNKIGLDDVRSMLGDLGQDTEFLTSFLAFGLIQAGVNGLEIGAKTDTYWQEVGWLEQHIALAASLQAYFGISTLGLLKVEEQ